MALQPSNSTDACQFPLCEHIKADGRPCGSPAMRGDSRCYHHSIRGKLALQSNPFIWLRNVVAETHSKVAFDLSPLQDAEAIQIGYMQLIHAVAERRIEPRDAKLILSALRGASANVREINKLNAQPKTGAPKRQPAGVDVPTQERAETVAR